ncbi:class A beta-lactamase [Novosphingobium sp. RD2P27]|uniref:beta-lactamase n=1 Tax=Novosphingobium kalidii TaxID=3230299 RepID=A0ABV2D5W6_9SPHN
MERRTVLAGAGAVLLSACVSPARSAVRFDERLEDLEKASGGRLGAFVLDTGSGQGLGWRQGERFCHCSSFKLSLAALVLREAAEERIKLDEPIRYGREDLMSVSPVTTRNLARGAMTFVELAHATQVTSDNAAANILMRRLGGPGAVTRFWRELGDPVSRLDAYEPALNRIPPGTLENSTTPMAMAHTVGEILYGDVLSRSDAERLRGWMRETATGARRIRAGLPGGWDAGDKTGTAIPDGLPATYVDIAFVAPPGRSPLIVASYFEDPVDSGGDMRPEAEGALAQVGSLAASWAQSRGETG